MLARLALVASVLLAVVSAGEEQATAGTPAPLGASEAELRQQLGDAIRDVAVTRPRSAYALIAETLPEAQSEPESEAPPDPYAGLERLAIKGTGDVAQIEFDLRDGLVYRVRWQLAPRFEEPLMASLVTRLTQSLGPPDYDQTLRAAIGSGRSELRRTGWTLAGRDFELRQLHPFTGGPVFLSLAERQAVQAIVDAGGTPLPQPDATGDWWRKPQRPPVLLSDAERAALVTAVSQRVDALLAEPPS
jgi:hypothetical protein